MPVPVHGTPLDPLGPGSWTQIAKDVGWIADTGYIAYAATTATRKARGAVLGGGNVILYEIACLAGKNGTCPRFRSTAMRRHLADAPFPPPLCLVSFLG